MPVECVGRVLIINEEMDTCVFEKTKTMLEKSRSGCYVYYVDGDYRASDCHRFDNFTIINQSINILMKL